MQSTSQNTYSGGQQLKAESLPRFVGINASDVTVGIAIPEAGAMQVGKEESVPMNGNEGRYFPEPTFAIPARYSVGVTATLKTKQSWEGTVIACEGDSFTAEVNDRTNPANPAEFVVFGLEEISADDRALINPGAAFYWTIGTERSPAGQIRNVNFVNFRRVPAWNRTSLKQADKRAQQVLSLFTQE